MILLSISDRFIILSEIHTNLPMTKEFAVAHFNFEYSDDEEENVIDYANNSYWDERYQRQHETSFDWYLHWKDLSPYLTNYLNKNGSTLVIGCGNSSMSEKLLNDGFDAIYNIDISPTVIEQMSQKYKDKPKLIWEVMDCTNLSYSDETFVSIFEKGTLDALLCNKSNEFVNKTLHEIYRVLSKNGKFFSITFGTPSSRLTIFKNVKLNWYLHPPIPFHYECENFKATKSYLYIFEKTH